MSDYSRTKYYNGFAGGVSHSPDMGERQKYGEYTDESNGQRNGMEDGAAYPQEMEKERASTVMTTDALYSQFAQKSQIRSRSTFTLPRSWSSWRLKSTNDLRGSKEQQAAVSLSEKTKTSDQDSTTSEAPKLKRRSSFRHIMDRFRRYKSTESLEERRKRPQRDPAIPIVIDAHHLEEKSEKVVVPVMGLQNHGNSCYINAVLQCLNNTAQIYEFFISGRYKHDLQRRNRENARKFGTQGELTEACGMLVQSLGSATYNSDISHRLIQVVAKYWSQFHDGVEQDAQEFWIWLMEKMHEDLNRKGRRKLKMRKSHKRDDVLAAATEEANGSSIISRLFSALSRSSLTCVQCGQQSNTFEDFTCLPIPLPQTDSRAFFVKVILADAQSHVIRYGFSTSMDASLQDVKDLISSKTYIRPEELLLLELNDNGFQRTITSDQDCDGMFDVDDLFALELVKVQDDNGGICLVMIHMATEENKGRRISSPRIMTVARDISYRALETSIVSNLDTTSGLLPSPPFRLHLVERNEYLNQQDDHPLLTESVDQCLTIDGAVSSLRHLKLYVEWESKYADLVAAKLVRERQTTDVTVAEVKNLPESSSTTTLSDCLDLFMKEETVGMDKEWECPACGAAQTGIVKRGTLWTLPEILVIHLKRFRQTASSRSKLVQFVEFPLHGLDMSRYLTKDDDIEWRSRGKTTKSTWLPWQKLRRPPDSQLNQVFSYGLFGVVNHHGRLNSGHYTAACRHPADGAWYLYDDLRVKTLEEQDIVTKDAYILFYQREPLVTYPSLYYNSFAKVSASSWSLSDLRTPTPRPSRSTDDIVDTVAQDERERQMDSEFTRTAHIYASLPRQPRRSIVHDPVHNSASWHNGAGAAAWNSVKVPVNKPDSVARDDSQMTVHAEHIYQRRPATSSLAASSAASGASGTTTTTAKTVRNDDWSSSSAERHVPQLVGYQQRPVQESCV